eukprot:1008896-Prorocentrum_minimum.AAC.1
MLLWRIVLRIRVGQPLVICLFTAAEAAAKAKQVRAEAAKEKSKAAKAQSVLDGALAKLQQRNKRTREEAASSKGGLSDSGASDVDSEDSEEVIRFGEEDEVDDEDDLDEVNTLQYTHNNS